MAFRVPLGWVLVKLKSIFDLSRGFPEERYTSKQNPQKKFSRLQHADNLALKCLGQTAHEVDILMFDCIIIYHVTQIRLPLQI